MNICRFISKSPTTHNQTTLPYAKFANCTLCVIRHDLHDPPDIFIVNYRRLIELYDLSISASAELSAEPHLCIRSNSASRPKQNGGQHRPITAQLDSKCAGAHTHPFKFQPITTHQFPALNMEGATSYIRKPIQWWGLPHILKIHAK